LNWRIVTVHAERSLALTALNGLCAGCMVSISFLNGSRVRRPAERTLYGANAAKCALHGCHLFPFFPCIQHAGNHAFAFYRPAYDFAIYRVYSPLVRGTLRPHSYDSPISSVSLVDHTWCNPPLIIAWRKPRVLRRAKWTSFWHLVASVPGEPPFRPAVCAGFPGKLRSDRQTVCSNAKPL